MSAVARIVAGVALIVLSFYTGGAAAALGKILFSVGTSLALGGLAQVIAGTPDTRLRRTGQDIEYTGTVEPRRIVYGTNKMSGMNTIPPWTSGENNDKLHQVLTVAGHRVEDITDVYFGNDVIADGDIGPRNNTMQAGKVSNGPYANKAWIRRYFGTGTQPVDFILNSVFPAQWTAGHRGFDVAYVALQFQYDEDVYKTGKPEVSFIVQGKRVYDPRLDVSPGANPDDPDFQVFSDNPALCLADYLIDARLGLGEDPERIEWNLVVAAANICDETVMILPASPSTSQKRYTCNIVLEVALDDEEIRANITLLASAMLGQAVYTSGVWKIYAGAAQSPTFDLNEDHILDRLTIRTEVPGNEKYNYVRGQFIDADRAYQLSEFEPHSNATYEAEDNGRRLPKEVVFSTCTDAYEAQRNAIIILKRSRRRKQLSAVFGMSAYKIRIWDTGTITLNELGWDAQLVRCTSWSFAGDGTIEATFLEEDPDDWADPDLSEYIVPAVSDNPGQGGFIPRPPESWRAVPQVDGILFIIELAVGGSPRGLLAQIFEGEVGEPFDSNVVGVTPRFSAFSSYVLAKTDTDEKDYWLVLSLRDVESIPVGPITAAALELTTAFHLDISHSYVTTFIPFDASAGNSRVVTVTPINGTAPFTYSWARISGDTTITALTPTSASTAFRVTGMSLGEVNSAIFRCTVTDNVAVELTIDCNVKFISESDQ